MSHLLLFHQFDGLQSALRASEELIKSYGTTALEAAAAQDSAMDEKEEEQDEKEKKEKKKPKRRRRARPQAKKKSKDARVKKFIKAARFVRGYGAAAIHPRAKIELHGLRMQALKGDCDATQDVATAQAGDEASSSSVLQRLKDEAWRSAKGKTQEEAMEEYL